jgi:hypothetical protein
MAKLKSARAIPARRRRLVAGSEARRRLAAILGVGLEPATGQWFLEQAESPDGRRLELSLRRGAKQLQIALKPLPSPACARSRHIGVGCNADAVGASVGRYLQILASRLGDRTIADLLVNLESAPDRNDADRAVREKEILSPGLGGRAGSREGKWWNFYADEDFDQEGNELVWTGARTMQVEIGERECRFARPRSDFRRWSFLNYPHMALPNAGTAGLCSLRRRAMVESASPELHENDVIMGIKAKEDEIVEAVRRRAGELDLILMGGSCTVAVMGVDLDALGRRCRDAGNCLLIGRKWNYRENSPESVADTFRMFLKDQAPAPSPAADPNAVNLFDFPSRYREEELIPFLAELGLRTNVCLLPEAAVEQVRRLPRAQWQVFRDQHSTASGLRGFFEERALGAVAVRAPYGIEASRRCLSAIAKAAGRQEAFEKAWQRHWETANPSWVDLSREARRYRLAFVAHERFAVNLTDPSLWRGVPFLEMLTEMGFGVDLLLYAPPEAAKVAPQMPADRFFRFPGLRTFVFQSRSGLEQRLKESESRAVFSDIYYDWRLTRAGKAQFSQRNFQMGLSGALRSLESLLAVCRLPFYQRYGAVLERIPRRTHG